MEEKRAIDRTIEQSGSNPIALVTNHVMDVAFSAFFDIDEQRAMIEIGIEPETFDPLARNILNINRTIYSRGRGIPNSPWAIALLPPRINGRIGIVANLDLKDVALGLQWADDVFKGKITALVMAKMSPVKIDVADLIDRLKLNDGVLIAEMSREIENLPIMEPVVFTNMASDAARRGFDGKRNDYFLVVFLRKERRFIHGEIPLPIKQKERFPPKIRVRVGESWIKLQQGFHRFIWYSKIAWLCINTIACSLLLSKQGKQKPVRCYTTHMQIQGIQRYLTQEGADAYILIDYENKNAPLVSLLGKAMLTRKIIAIIPKKGRLRLVVHSIDAALIKGSVEADFYIYKTWTEMLELQKSALGDCQTILMDYSPDGLLMRVASADAGSVEYVRSLGKTIKSSANLLQQITAVLTDEQYAEELKACAKTLRIKDEAFTYIKKQIQSAGEVSEYAVAQFIANRFTEEGMVFDEPPLVASGKNAANPHYCPTPSAHSILREGDLVLIDMWAKEKNENGVYADITWMGYIGKEVPKEFEQRFEIIKAARDGVISFLKNTIGTRPVYAYEADDVARKIIGESGYGDYFIHRVGHNIAVDISCHGPGANLDNYETHDDRLLLDGLSFSDEPGIYAPDFGMRTETNLHIKGGKVAVVAGLQDSIIPILK